MKKEEGSVPVRNKAREQVSGSRGEREEGLLLVIIEDMLLGASKQCIHCNVNITVN